MTVRYRFAAALVHADLALRRARGSLADARAALAAAQLACDTALAAGSAAVAGPWATVWSLRDLEGWSAGQAARERSAADILSHARDTVAIRVEACVAARRDAERLERHRARDRVLHARASERRDERERDEANFARASRGPRR